MLKVRKLFNKVRFSSLIPLGFLSAQFLMIILKYEGFVVIGNFNSAKERLYNLENPFTYLGILASVGLTVGQSVEKPRGYHNEWSP